METKNGNRIEMKRMLGRRAFLTANVGMAVSARLAARSQDAIEFGFQPAANRLDQGPFKVEQDEGWYTLTATTASA